MSWIEDPQSRFVKLRLTESLYNLIRDIAAELGMPTSVFLRHLIYKDIVTAACGAVNATNGVKMGITRHMTKKIVAQSVQSGLQSIISPASVVEGEVSDMDIKQMAQKGKAKYASKKSIMVANYQAAISRAVENYRSVGFGPQMNRSYEAGINLGKQFYTETALDENRWEKLWLAKVTAGLPPMTPAAPGPGASSFDIMSELTENVSKDASADSTAAVNPGRPPILEVAMSVSPSTATVSKDGTSEATESISKREAEKGKATG